MIYSVPRPGGRFDYYESERPPRYRQNQQSPIGTAIVQALPMLPDDALLRGNGLQARGTVVVDSGVRRRAVAVRDIAVAVGLTAGTLTLLRYLVGWLR